MKKPNEIELELQSLGVDIPSLHTPFEVPENYFSELAPELNIRLLETAFTPLSPYSVPEGYFATFVSSLQHETALPVTSTPYSIPDHYLDEFPSRLAQHMKIPNRSFRLVIHRNFQLAASIFLFLGLSYTLLFQRNPGTSFNTEHELAQLDDNEIRSYYQQHQVLIDQSISLEYPSSGTIPETGTAHWVEDILNHLSDEEIAEYNQTNI